MDPDLAYEAVEQVRAQAGRNVIAVVEARFAELQAEIRILQRVIWPLIGIVATTVFGLLHQSVIW